MHSSKLLELISSFDLEELEKLDLFLNSPYFFEGKVNENTLKLFRYIKQFYPCFPIDQISKKRVYSYLFPGEEAVKGKLEKTMTKLLKQVKQFIVFENLEHHEDELHKLILEAKFYRKKDLEKYFYKTIELLKKKQDNVVKRGKVFYYNQYLLEREISEYESFYNARKKDLNLPSTLRSIDVFYIITKQEFMSQMLVQHKYHIPIDQQDSLKILDKISETLRDENYLNVPLIEIYDHVLKLLSQENSDHHFEKLKVLVDSKKDQLPIDQLKALYTIFRNYSIRQYHNGKRQYLAEAFELYKEHLDGGYLFYEGGLLPSTIKNIVDLGLKFNQIDWVYTFLLSTKDKIVGTKKTDEVYHFNLANYHFAIKEYDKAVEYLEANYEDSYYKIAARRLEIKIYYETKSVLLNSKLEAFKIFIFRVSKSKLHDLQKQGNNNFVDIIKRISAVKTAKNASRINKLIEHTKEKTTIAEKKWLINKLEELL